MDKSNNFLGNLNDNGTCPGMCMRHEEMGNMFGDKTGKRGHDKWWRKVGVGCRRLSNGRHVMLDVHSTKQ